MSTLSGGLALARRGVPVLPLHEPVGAGTPDVSCSCRRADCTSAGKHPRTVHGLADASTDPDVIAGWWRRWPTANVGACTGVKFDALDLDGPPGLCSLAQLLDAGRVPDVLATVVTGRSFSWHLLVPPTGRGNRTAVLDGVDYRGRNGYVVAPPSLHASGRRYAWQAIEPVGPAEHRRILEAAHRGIVVTGAAT
jgi:hypothetical protein